MKKQSLRFLTLTLIGILIYSCQNEFETEPIVPVQQVKPENITKLGKKLENPFSVTNMQRALDTILKEVKKSKSYQAKSFQKSAEQIEIKETDLYVRFLPKDSLELDLIKKDTTIIFYDHPLDYEIEEQGEHYHDPEIPEDQITWQYTVVKPDYEFPEVQHEILSDLFIPENSEGYYEEEDTNTQGKSSYSKTNSLSSLETVSLYLTNNLTEEEKEEIEQEKEKNLQAKRVCVWFICWNVPDRWNPSGTVKIEDTELGWQPVQGVKVRARRWFTTKTARTNSNGYFKTGSFRRPANYSIVWETYQFSIREKWWCFFSQQAWVNGPKMKSPWNVNLTKHSKHWFHGTIFQAAYHYYYQNIKGLKRPPTNSFWKPQMKIRAHFEQNNEINGSHQKDARIFGIFARIHMYNPQNSSSSIYATTIHELAHASHWELRKNNWNFGNTHTKVKESWARGVEWELTRMKYPASKYKGRFWNTNSKDYTLVVADLIDNDFNNSYEATNRGFIDSRDQVSGFTISQLEYSIKNVQSWNDWRDRLIGIKGGYDYNNNITRLFGAYE